MTELICELGINANGDMNIAQKLIDVASSAGCHYVKFQKRDIDLVYSEEELNKYRESPWGTTTREQKQGLEFNIPQYYHIDMWCKSKPIKWFASVWDLNSLGEMMNMPGCEFIKIPSALITNKGLLESCRAKNKPVILSTGMSTLDMLDDAIDILGKDKIHCIMHCTSTYPSKPEEINLRCIPEMKRLYPWAKIGFSNHYPGLSGMVRAYCYGAEMLEMHITLSRAMWGSDQAASIEPRGLFDLINRLTIMEQMKGDGIKKIYVGELPIIKKLRR